MNKPQLLNYMLKDVALSPSKNRYNKPRNLNGKMLELYSRRKTQFRFPLRLPSHKGRMETALKRFYKNDVAKISLILNHHFPKDFIFFRPSKLDPELYAGFDFFSDIVTQFADFRRVKRNAFDDYLSLNEKLLSFARNTFPRKKSVRCH